MKRPPLVRRARRRLGLSQEEFAKRFRIPLGSLRDWEQGSSVPSKTAQAYIEVISVDLDSVQRVLTRKNTVKSTVS